VLAGDFLSPSVLSSVDQGRGMVDVLGRAGVRQASPSPPVVSCQRLLGPPRLDASPVVGLYFPCFENLV
jgi:hypothetical protein